MEKLDTLSRWLDYNTGAQDNWDIVLLHLDFLIVCALEGFSLKDKEYSILRISIMETGVENKRNQWLKQPKSFNTYPWSPYTLSSS